MPSTIPGFILSNEEMFIIDVLFNYEKSKKNIDLINFEKVIKISSAHLMLPSLYNNLLIKNYKKNFS